VSSLFNKAQPTTTTQTPSLPSWVTQAQQGQLSAAQSLPAYTPYTGQTVAPLTPAQLQAIQAAISGAGQYQPAVNNVIGAPTPTINTGQVNQDTQSLLNPFIGDVVGTTNQQLEDALTQQNKASDLTDASVGALGGGRAGVQTSLNNYYGNLALGSTDASLLNTGFQEAQQGALGINQANQAATLQKLGLNLSGAATGENLNTQDIASLLATGGAQQQTNQLQDTTNLQEYQNAYNSLLQKYGLVNNTLGAITGSNTTNTTQGQSFYSPLGTIAGLGLSGAALGKAGAFSGISSLFSPASTMGAAGTAGAGINFGLGSSALSAADMLPFLA
jgi:hypothetical protein